MGLTKVSEPSQAAGDLLPGSCTELGPLTARSYDLVSSRESEWRPLLSLLGWSTAQKSFLNLLVNNSWRCPWRGWRSGHFKEPPRYSSELTSMPSLYFIKWLWNSQKVSKYVDKTQGVTPVEVSLPLGRSSTRWWPFCRLYQRSWRTKP